MPSASAGTVKQEQSPAKPADAASQGKKSAKASSPSEKSTGKGKGGQSIWGAEFNDEINDSLKHNARGIVSMANSGPNTNKSQFFISYAPQPSLDLKYTAFGKVIDGLTRWML